jgi:uncharacterized protein YqgQ
MKNLLSIIQLLKRFGIYVYTGNRKDDIDLMMSEVKDLYDGGLIQQDEYLKAILLLRFELANNDLKS